MIEISRGDRVTALSADGVERHLRALTGVQPGGDFAVVWACSESEWDRANSEGREPEGIPWPAEDVRLTESIHAVA